MATKAKTSIVSKNNPNKVNQYTAPDPRQALFLTHYLDPSSPTFSNGLQSALKAGYTREYAENILAKMPEWLSDEVGRLDMLRKAERNLLKVLDLETNLPVIGMFGHVYEQIPTGKRNKNTGKEMFKRGKIIKAESHKLLAIQADVTKFVAERIGRRRYGPKEAPAQVLNFNFISDDQLRRIATRTINGDSAGEAQPD